LAIFQVLERKLLIIENNISISCYLIDKRCSVQLIAIFAF